MKSKTSCFNKAIFRKNMSRFWPVCAVYLAYLFFHMTVRMFLNTRSYITALSAPTHAGQLQPSIHHYIHSPRTESVCMPPYTVLTP